MPQPTQDTSDIYDKANRVVKIEMLPIPNIPADFMVNHNTEVALMMIRDLWEALGPAPITGVNTTYNQPINTWTLHSGRILFNGYDITIASDFEFIPTPGEVNTLILRVVERQVSYETDPSIVGFTPLGFPSPKPGMNQYRYTATVLNKLESDAAYALVNTPGVLVESSFVEIPLLTLDGDGEITQQVVPINNTVFGLLPDLIQQIQGALALRAEGNIQDTDSLDLNTVFTTATPLWQFYEERLMYHWHFGHGSENWGIHPYGGSAYVQSVEEAESETLQGFPGAVPDFYGIGGVVVLPEAQVEAAVAQNAVGFGLEGDFGNTPFGYPGTTPSGADSGWGIAPMGVLPLGVPCPADLEPLYLGLVLNTRFEVQVKCTSSDVGDNSTWSFKMHGVLPPNLKVIGSV